MINPSEARQIAKRANDRSSDDFENVEMGRSDAAVEAAIDQRLRNAMEDGETGCFFESYELGDDPERMIAKYRENGWDVDFNEKITSWYFQPKADPKDDENVW